jgi:hypothetical protein
MSLGADEGAHRSVRECRETARSLSRSIKRLGDERALLRRVDRALPESDRMILRASTKPQVSGPRRVFGTHRAKPQVSGPDGFPAPTG